MKLNIIAELVPVSYTHLGINNGEKYQTLLGATGTGKTFTIANIVKNVGKPTLVLAHNKTLAGQLYNELKEFFPNNRVEYFVSYYDYFQPEAYVPVSYTHLDVYKRQVKSHCSFHSPFYRSFVYYWKYPRVS